MQRHERVRTHLRVLFGIETPEREGVAQNISEGGLFISTNEIFTTGTRIRVQIHFPERPIVREVEVQWAIQVPPHLRDAMVCGMGVSFVGADPWWPLVFRQWRASLALPR